MSQNNTIDCESRDSVQPKIPVRNDYKKRRPKKQIAIEKRVRAYARLNKHKANCGEDTVAQSYQVRHQHHDGLLWSLKRSKWDPDTDELTLKEQSLILNGCLFVPCGKDALLDFKSPDIHYKYRCSGIELGFTGGNREVHPKDGAQANVFTRMGYEALLHGLPQANSFIEKIIASIPSEIWFSKIKRIDAHIDVTVPYSVFYELYERGMFRGRMGKEKDEYERIDVVGEVIVRKRKETIYINLCGNIVIVIYNKLAELNKPGNEHKRDAYIQKFGPLPSVLTRIEIRIYRNFLRGRGYDTMHNSGELADFSGEHDCDTTHRIDTVNDWQKCKAATIKHIMTRQFRFTDKNGNTMPEWEWAMDQYIKWASAENEMLGITELPIQKLKSKTKMTEIEKFCRNLSASRRNA